MKIRLIKYSSAAFLLVLLLIVGVFGIGTVPASAEVTSGAPSLVRDLEVANGRMEQFNKDITNYTIELNEGETRPVVNVKPYDDSCAVEVSGTDTDIVGTGERLVTVYAYDTAGDSVTYYLHVFIYSEYGGLSFLDCSNGSISPKLFVSSRRNYYITIPNAETAAELEIRTVKENAEYVLIGNEELEAGRQTRLVLTVTDSDGSYVYYLYVYREAPVTGSLDSGYLLYSVTVNEGAVTFEFDQNRAYYEIPVPKSVTTLNVTAVAQDASNRVTVVGASAMSDTQTNVVNIIVSDAEDVFAGQSVYTFVFYYDTFTSTAVYTGFQMFAAVLAAVVIVGVIAIVCFVLLNVRKNENNDGGAPTEVTEVEKTAAEIEDDAGRDGELAVADGETGTAFGFASKYRVKPFAERLELASEDTRRYYYELREELLNYERVKSRISIKCDSYRIGRKLLCKMNIVGKTLRFYIALDPAELKETVYRHKDVGKVKTHGKTPTVINIKSDRWLEKAKRLIVLLLGGDPHAKEAAADEKNADVGKDVE